MKTKTVDAEKDPVSEITHSFPIRFTFYDNRILVPVMINGKGPFTFIFDTGGARTNTITPEASKKLGLTLTEGNKVSGAGSGLVPSSRAKVDQYSIGDLVLKNQDFTIVDLSPIKKAFKFPALDGIVGLAVLQEAVACIDFEKQILILSNSDVECFDRRGTVLPFRLDGRTPAIAGSVNGVSGELIIDPGDRSAFSLFQKFGTSSGVAQEFADKPELLTGVGVGGVIPAKMTTLHDIKLGNKIQLHKVLARLPLTKGNYFATSNSAGAIGNEVLRRFNVIFNYKKHEITLIQNSHFDDPYGFTPPVIN